ncbi:MAG: DUF99 family protein [Candidatus Bathyarchaeia archaeon]
MFKREVRVLGLTYRSYDDHRFILGVVFRGKLWFDGILYRRFDCRRGILDELIDMFSESPHRGQVRVIVLDNLLYSAIDLLGVEKIHSTFNLPVVVLDDGKVIVAVGLDNVDDFMRVAGLDGKVEALRVASMIADRLLELLTFKSQSIQ